MGMSDLFNPDNGSWGALTPLMGVLPGMMAAGKGQPSSLTSGLLGMAPGAMASALGGGAPGGAAAGALGGNSMITPHTPQAPQGGSRSPQDLAQMLMQMAPMAMMAL